MAYTQRFFMVHHDDLESCLNLEVLTSKLTSGGMLTFDEMESLNLAGQTTRSKIQRLVQIMCRKGKRAPELFLQCLRSATEHLPHSDLADKMEQWLREHSGSVDTPTLQSENTTISQQHIPTPQSSQEMQSSQVLPTDTISSDHQLTSTTSSSLATVNVDSDPAATPPSHAHNVSTQPASNPQVPPSQPSTLTIGRSEQSTTIFPTVNVNVHIHNHPSSVSTSQEPTARTSVTNPSLTPNPPAQHSSSLSSSKTLAQPILEQHSWPNTRPPIQQPADTLHHPIQEESISPQPGQYSHNVTPAQEETSHEPIVTPQSQTVFQPPAQETSVHAPLTSKMESGTQQGNSSVLIPLNYPSSITENVSSFVDQLNKAPSSYVMLICNLASLLDEKEVSIDTLLRLLNKYFKGIILPSEAARNLPALCGYLRTRGYCNEADIDLLDRFFTDLGHEDMQSMISDYARQIRDEKALNNLCGGATPTESHYLLTTSHRCAEMSLGQAFQVKELIAELLHLPRYMFTLVSTQGEPTVLVWRVPMSFLKNFNDLKTTQAKSELDRDRTLQSVRIEFIGASRVHCEEVYSKSKVTGDHHDTDPTLEETMALTGDKRSTAPPSEDPDLGPSSPTKPRLSSPTSDLTSESLKSLASQKRHKRPPIPLDTLPSYPPPRRPKKFPPPTDQGPRTSLPPHQSPREFAQQYIPQPFSEPFPPLSDAEKQPSPEPDSSRPPPSSSSQRGSHSAVPPLQVLANTLRGTYKNPNLFMRAAGPNIKPKFINLALVKKKMVSFADREKDKFLKSTLHGSIDDIVKMKEEIFLQKIFSYGRKESRKVVLVEGAPGVGKTMLALRLCQMWAKGELLSEEYDLVLLVTLRRFQGKSRVKLNDIVNISLEDEISDQCTKALYQLTGERVLIILEGWDELPPELREEGTFFFDIIEGSKLPDASVLVTSRPTVTADLYDYMDERHIEVLGFNSEQITEYVQTNGRGKAEIIISHLEKFPNLKALAHIPLTLSIICHVASKEQTLPHTLTELYNMHICNTILQNLKKQPSKELKSLSGLSCLDGLPEEVDTVVQKLSTLALNGFKIKKFVFGREDLVEVGLDLKAPSDKSFDGFGLLNAPLNSAVAGFEQIFQFNHLSIQEFLAAYGIQQLKHKERVSLLRRFRKDKQFQNIWKFFSGITRLEDKDFRKIVISETGKTNKDQLFLLHCLYEANNPEISQVAAEKMFRVLNLNNMFLNTTDCLCAAHMITSAGGEWNVDLRGCNIGEEGLRIISTSLLSHVEEHGVEGFLVTRFNFTQNRLKASSLTHLANMLTTNMQLQGLEMASNNFGDVGMTILADALKVNKTVKALHFSSCELTTVGGIQLAEVLEVNETITEIYIGFEPLGSEGVTRLALAMEKNHTLTEISLTKTEMTSVGLAALVKTLEINSTLEVLRLDRNDLQASDCKLVATILEKNNSLILIDLSKNPIGDNGFEMLLEALIGKPTSSLKKLGVFGCEITNKGLEKLVQFFAVTQTFVGIQLGCNELGDEGAKLIGEALMENSKSSNTVKQVLLETTGVSDKGKKKLEKICDSINSGRDSDNKLDVNYKHHSQVVEKRNSTNYL